MTDLDNAIDAIKERTDFAWVMGEALKASVARAKVAEDKLAAIQAIIPSDEDEPAVHWYNSDWQLGYNAAFNNVKKILDK